MTDLLVTNGTVITQNADREVVDDGAVLILDDKIAAVGPAAKLETDYDADRVIDADGGAIIPGLVNAHTHVSDILLRGAFAADRGLHDWLYNVKRPACVAMVPEEHAVAAALYCTEAVRAGVTTFVESDTEVIWDDRDAIEAKFDAYARSGIRSIYGAGFADSPPDEAFELLLADVQVRDPDIAHPPADYFTMETDTALTRVESLIREFHGNADGRQSVWPSPIVLASTTAEGFRGAYRIAEEYDLMTTAHVAEAEAQERGAPLSNISYLRNVGYLGERALLGHCVQIDAADVRLLAKTNTKVAHNFFANMRLATGFAPVVSMLENGVVVGLGTDNANLNDAINPLADARAASAAHKGFHRDPGVVPAQTAFDMVTIDAARAIGREDDLGSIEVGKQADIAIVDMDRPHLTPSPNPVFALVTAAQGDEVETVICAGEVVMEDREVLTLGDTDELMTEATAAADDLVERVGIE
ncbi:amidohydrolase [Natrialba sp. PRR66]|uniref:amidohydrolase family protein n=1 Tax=Natrialba sp. PRR66 TaxID=3098146 RepID=UPI002B1DFA85|nr:amidohydrolase [Natrialba sp. PRR66]